MKTCTRCNEEKDIEQFNWRNKSKGWRLAWCKPCVKAYDATRTKTEKYRNTKKQQVQSRIERNRIYVGEYLFYNPCIDCGNKDVRVLDFDHRDGVEKVGNISEMIHRSSLKSIVLEIRKCDVRCANCHRIRTGEQFGFWRSATYKY